MKKETNIGWLVAFIIVIGISISSVIIYFTYNRVISDNSQSIAELSTMNIYSEINSEWINLYTARKKREETVSPSNSLKVTHIEQNRLRCFRKHGLSFFQLTGKRKEKTSHACMISRKFGRFMLY